ncbi:alpha/beta hydrolase [Sphingomonas sp. BN140010]|uniref:Alpha/beta hydrolase n=1 Tax=Sphingomonas arvum TaxID=2992113 RepID=A0ABT3JDH0_9SPHN|nr:alpha/beta hydrolase [Sphingomonas sp. BN140010]MCW3796810.1 alpha/beta hydrolase [Sphingomonas sp. BN140010]
MPYAKAKDGTMLYYKDWGRGDPVVLLHGWPLTGDTFDDLAIKLVEAGKRCIIPDRRGFGRSEQPWDGYDYDTFADDVVAILEDANISQPVALVGFSMGGGEVARLVSRQGKGRISAAVLASSVVPRVVQGDDYPDGVPQAKLDEITAQMQTDRAGFLQTFLKQFYGVGFVTQPISDGVLDAGFHQAIMAGARSTYAAAQAWATTDFRGDLPAFEGIPTLILHGTSDKNVPFEGTGKKVAEALPHAQLITYDGSPHGIFETDKDRFARDVVGFLTQNNGRKAADQSGSAIPLTAQ